MPRILISASLPAVAALPPERRPYVKVWDDAPMWVRRRLLSWGGAVRAGHLTAEEMAYLLGGLQIEAIGGDWRPVSPAFDPEEGGKAPVLPNIHGDKDEREQALSARSDFYERLGKDDANAIYAAFEDRIGLKPEEEKK